MGELANRERVNFTVRKDIMAALREHSENTGIPMAKTIEKALLASAEIADQMKVIAMRNMSLTVNIMWSAMIDCLSQSEVDGINQLASMEAYEKAIRHELSDLPFGEIRVDFVDNAQSSFEIDGDREGIVDHFLIQQAIEAAWDKQNFWVEK